MLFYYKYLASLVLFISNVILSQGYVQNPSSLPQDLDEDAIQNLIISEKPSIILFYSQSQEDIKEQIFIEYLKLAQLLDTSGLDVNLAMHAVLSSGSAVQRFKLKGLPSIKLIIEGKAYEYTGKKIATALFDEINNKISKTIQTIYDESKLTTLITGEHAVLVFFINDSGNQGQATVPDISSVRRVFSILVDDWADYVHFVFARDIAKLHIHEDLNVNNGDIWFFKKHWPFQLNYKGDLVIQQLSSFITRNIYPKVNLFDAKFHNFIKRHYVTCLLLVAKPKDSHLEEVIVKVSRELEAEIFLAIFYDEDPLDPTTQQLQRLIGSGVPFAQSQVFIIDYRTGAFKFYRMETSITKENMQKYIGYWNERILKSLLRSELLPDRSEDPVEKIVGRNYMQRVMVPEYDAYVAFHFEDCGEPCDKLLSMEESLAAQFGSFRTIKFFKFDVSLNDVIGLQLAYVPAFGVYLKNDKVLKLYEEESISYKKMVDFINDFSKLLSKEEYEKIEKESQIQEFENLITDMKNKQKQIQERFKDEL